MTNPYPRLSPFRLFRASVEKFIMEPLLEKVGACAIGFVNRNIGQCLQDFCPFQHSQKMKMAGNNQKHVKSLFQSPEPGLHRVSNTKMSFTVPPLNFNPLENRSHFP